MYGFQEVVESSILEILADDESVEDLDIKKARMSDEMSELVDGVSAIVLDRIEARALSGDLKAYWKEKRAFVARLREFWKEPLNQLELFMTLATEVGFDFNGEYRKNSIHSEDAVFEALTRLHSRACQISWAVHTLLQSGFADDAHARWRSLHEISVVSMFICQHGQGVAERYLDHGVVQRFKLACQMRNFQEKTNAEPITEEEFNGLKSRRDRLLSKYGPSFGKDLGWAADALKIQRPNFSDLEKHVNLEHMRPYYRMSSDNIHANSHGTYFRLGLSLPGDDTLLAGPSNAGLADPGHSTAISLHQVTTSLLSTKPTFDWLVVMKVLKRLRDRTGEEFLKSHLELKALATEDYEAEKKK